MHHLRPWRENYIDNEYFITSSKQNPRISGSNTWVKYGDNQVSLGYMGIYTWTSTKDYYKDMWIDNSPISEPFNGIRCNKGGECPSSGYIQADHTDQFGFYHTRAIGAGLSGGYYGFASFSEQTFEYFRGMAAGNSESFRLNFCSTRIDFDYLSGERCKDQSSGTWNVRSYTVNKIGHLSLISTNAFQELWIASDGTPSISKDGGYCSLGSVSGEDGVICKMIAYELNQTENLNTSLTMQMYADNTVLGFAPARNTIKYSGDGQNWYSYDVKTVYDKIFSNGGEYVFVFLSKTFLKKFVDEGISISTSQPFNFGFYNSVSPESGYYQFSPSLSLSIVPKEYGISIVSINDTLSASGSGKIGDTDPIEMDYIVTVSGPRQADTITAQVTGDSTTINGIPYCLFQSTKDSLFVPVPAYLQYNSQHGGIVQKRNSCNEPAIDIGDALWQQTPWDVNNNDDGSYFTTDLKLLFPMDDSRSKLTVSGADWEGVVSATGEVKVTANWVGVTP